MAVIAGLSVIGPFLVVAVMSKRVPTERQVLRRIYEPSFPIEDPNIGKVMVAIDIEAVAKKLSTDKHVLFGYLYYHLDHKYRYQTGENSYVHLFTPRVGELRHAINLP